MNFEWDPNKAAVNFEKHGVTFESASTVFLDPLAVTYPDPDHSGDEHREITLGHTMKQELVFVAHVQRQERTRIISARRLTMLERRQYEKRNR